MASINNVTLVGRLVRDVEEQSTKTGKKVCNFTLAVDGYNKDADADFINCVAWGNIVDVLVQWTGKGKQIGITGRLATSSYEDKDGNRRYKTEVVVRDLQLLGSKLDGVGGQAEARPEDYPDDEPVNLSDIPF